MHSFALKGIPIIEQTDRQGIFLCLTYFPLVKNVYYVKWKFQEAPSLFFLTTLPTDFGLHVR